MWVLHLFKTDEIQSQRGAVSCPGQPTSLAHLWEMFCTLQFCALASCVRLCFIRNESKSVIGTSPVSVPPLRLCFHRSAWLKPCCGKRAAVWQVFLLSASLNSFLVACVILVVILLTLELLIDIKLLQCE